MISGTGSVGEVPYELQKLVKDVVIEEGVTEINAFAFLWCYSLTSVSLPESMESIGISAFMDCSSLSNINLPDGISSIGQYAFENCSSLRSINLPDGIRSIGVGTFKDCSNLEEVSIPSGVTYIGSGAFAGCSSLNSLYIPEGLTGIDESAYEGCSSLNSVEVAAGNAYYVLENGVLFNKQKTKILLYPRKRTGTYQIPEGVTSIGNHAFAFCTNLESIIIPEGITSIGDNAFKECDGLESINLPTTVNSMGSSAFSGCSNLITINLPEGIRNINNETFLDCSSLESIHLPESVVYISTSAFANCSNLKSINLPDGITDIRESAFSGCMNLTSIDLPESMAKIFASTFSGCSSLQEVKLPEKITSIGNSAFAECSSLSSIELPVGLTSMGDSIFSGCGSLSNIELPAGLTTMGDSIFSGCGSLSNIELPAELTTIGNSVFSDCSSLMGISLPESLTSMGDSTFSGCVSLESIRIPEGVTSIDDNVFKGCIGLKTISLPSEIDIRVGILVRTSPKIFSDCVSLERIEVPENGTYCSSIDGVLFDKDKTTLLVYPKGKSGDYEIPEGVTRVEDLTYFDCGNAFSGCSKLTGIKIPKSVEELPANIFSGCSALERIDVDSANKNYFSDDGVLFNKMNAILCCPAGKTGDYKIPQGVQFIGINAFSMAKNLSSIEIPISVNQIEEDAFVNCSNLKIYCVKNSYAHEYAEKNGLEYELVSSGGAIGENCSYTIDTEGNMIISGSGRLEEIPEELKKVMVNVTVEGEIDTIGFFAFINCNNLVSVNLSEGITEIELASVLGSIFSGCSMLERIDVDPANENYYSEDGVLFNKTNAILCYPAGKTGDYKIPESVEYIMASAFSMAEDLSSLEIPISVNQIEEGAFVNCPNLKIYCVKNSYAHEYAEENDLEYELVSADGTIGENCSYTIDTEGNVVISGSGTLEAIPETLKSIMTYVTVEQGIDRIGDFAFYNCSNLTSINIPEGVSYIGSGAFMDCYSLEDVTIPKSVIEIGGKAFEETPWLSMKFKENNLLIINGILIDVNVMDVYGELVLPEGVTGIGESAFTDCYDLESIVLPEGITKIGESAFSGCDFLQSVSIPESVVEIGEYAFDGCDNLRIHCIENSKAHIYAKELGIPYIFSGIGARNGMIGENCSYIIDSQGNMIISGSGTLEGELPEEVAQMVKSVVIQEGITVIGSSVFWQCKNLKTVQLPQGLTLLAVFSFEGCSGLESINIPEGVTAIGQESFYNCSSLKEITIPKSVTSIGYLAFEDCYSLENVVLSEGLKEIHEEAFYDCWSLTDITIPESVTSIGNKAFYECKNLRSIVIPESVTSIGVQAFYPTQNVTIYCKENSYAHMYAVQNDISYSLIDKQPTISQNPNNVVNNNPQGNSGNQTGNMEIDTQPSQQLPEKTQNPSVSKKTLKKGSIHTVGTNKYKVTSGTTMTFSGSTNVKVKKVVIPKTVKVGKTTYKVTAIAAKAFQKKNITSITIGENVTSIGKNAFLNCQKLKTITIKSKKLKSIGKNAFRGINKKAKIKVPKQKLKAYKKLLKNKGQGKQVKITK